VTGVGEKQSFARLALKVVMQHDGEFVEVMLLHFGVGTFYHHGNTSPKVVLVT
jgi:hypothetical protein